MLGAFQRGVSDTVRPFLFSNPPVEGSSLPKECLAAKESIILKVYRLFISCLLSPFTFMYRLCQSETSSVKKETAILDQNASSTCYRLLPNFCKNKVASSIVIGGIIAYIGHAYFSTVSSIPKEPFSYETTYLLVPFLVAGIGVGYIYQRNDEAIHKANVNTPEGAPQNKVNLSDFPTVFANLRAEIEPNLLGFIKWSGKLAKIIVLESQEQQYFTEFGVRLDNKLTSSDAAKERFLRKSSALQKVEILQELGDVLSHYHPQITLTILWNAVFIVLSDPIVKDVGEQIIKRVKVLISQEGLKDKTLNDLSEGNLAKYLNQVGILEKDRRKNVWQQSFWAEERIKGFALANKKEQYHEILNHLEQITKEISIQLEDLGFDIKRHFAINRTDKVEYDSFLKVVRYVTAAIEELKKAS